MILANAVVGLLMPAVASTEGRPDVRTMTRQDSDNNQAIQGCGLREDTRSTPSAEAPGRLG